LSLEAPQAQKTLTALAHRVLSASAPDAKVKESQNAVRAWRAEDNGERPPVGDTLPPERPARPARPRLAAPKDMPKRSTGGATGRFNLLHAVAHIEFNAIDLAWDLVARFSNGPDPLPSEFFDDWIQVADDETRHFSMIAKRLGALGGAYGDLVAHDGLWEAAETTKQDLLARLAVVPLVLEARGLDVTPAMIKGLRAAGDEASARCLETILHDEITHVACGFKWFNHLCHIRGVEPLATHRALVDKFFRGRVKPPFNEKARKEAGLLPEFYHNPFH